MTYEINEHHTTLRPDQRGRLTLRNYLRQTSAGSDGAPEYVEYRVHPYRDGAILLRPVAEEVSA